MPLPICCKCKCEMTVARNDVMVKETMFLGVYKEWMGDRYICPRCGAQFVWRADEGQIVTDISFYTEQDKPTEVVEFTR